MAKDWFVLTLSFWRTFPPWLTWWPDEACVTTTSESRLRLGPDPWVCPEVMLDTSLFTPGGKGGGVSPRQSIRTHLCRHARGLARTRTNFRHAHAYVMNASAHALTRNARPTHACAHTHTHTHPQYTQTRIHTYARARALIANANTQAQKLFNFRDTQAYTQSHP